MEVRELFTRLSYGVLSNLAVGAEGAGMIQENRQPAIIAGINDALMKLHSRFILREEDLILIAQSHITRYSLTLEHAMSQDPQPGVPQYIYDSEHKPFQGDVIKILNVYASNNRELFLNDAGRLDSLHTPQPTVLQIPYPVTGHNFAVVYQAKHPKIEYGDLCAEITIPDVLESALIFYIAAHVFGNMTGQEHTAKGQEFMMKYEAECQQAIDMDLVSNSVSTSTTKFSERGFV